jgi:AcrR family transcriptional regulator
MAEALTEPRKRRSAEERREEIVGIAIRHFGLTGYHATSTEAIAQDAGISQPDLFRLFKTKRDLFVACLRASDERIIETFRRAAAGLPGDEALAAMGKAYVEQLSDTSALLFQLQSYAATADPVIREQVRAGYGRIVGEVTQLSGATPEEVWQFFSHGMLLNVVAALHLEEIADRDPWAAGWCEPGELIELSRSHGAA